jgi:ketosteroid isomerase-like protein
MKAHIYLKISAVLLLAVAIALPARAQDNQKAMAEFVKQFQEAYNKADSKLLMTHFAKETVFHNADGTSRTQTNTQVEESYVKLFSTTDAKTEIKLSNVEALKDGKLRVQGTYVNTYINKKTGEKTVRKGTYDNSSIMEDGKWKVCSMKLIENK